MFIPTVMIALIATKRSIKVEETLERQVNKWKANDQDYLDTVIAGDT